jgi:DNA-binding FadR family transcriptional regulator
MYNAFRAAYEPALAALATAMPAKVKRPDDYRKLADAICSGDPARAKKAAEDVLELANTTLMAALDSAGNRR